MCIVASNSIYYIVQSSMGFILSCPTACVTHVLQRTGSKADAFTSWSCGDAPENITLLQTTTKGGGGGASSTGGSKAGGGGTASAGSSSNNGGSSSSDGNRDASAQGAGAGGGGPSSTVANIVIIAGVIQGVLLLLRLAGCLFWRYRRTRRRREEQRVRHEGYTKAFKLRDPGGHSEALMGSTQTERWLMNQQGDRMTVVG